MHLKLTVSPGTKTPNLPTFQDRGTRTMPPKARQFVQQKLAPEPPGELFVSGMMNS